VTGGRKKRNASRFEDNSRRPHMKALVLNALGRGFNFEDVDSPRRLDAKFLST
jgi:hypothetical protein